MNEKPQIKIRTEDDEENPLRQIVKSVQEIPKVLESGVDRYFTHNEHKQESKERIEIKKMDNEKHEGNLKAALLVIVLICVMICYLSKGIDQ